jgi:hypothetical protein
MRPPHRSRAYLDRLGSSRLGVRGILDDRLARRHTDVERTFRRPNSNRLSLFGCLTTDRHCDRRAFFPCLPDRLVHPLLCRIVLILDCLGRLGEHLHVTVDLIACEGHPTDAGAHEESGERSLRHSECDAFDPPNPALLGHSLLGHSLLGHWPVFGRLDRGFGLAINGGGGGGS